MEASHTLEREQGKALDQLRRGALLLDLETTQSGKILKFGAVLGDRTLGFSGSFSLSAALNQLSDLGRSATCVLGHNLVRHDLAVLREVAPGHPVLRLPVIDTLVLSPIAFPENPYHRLVKDYKLVRESVNDPVADARQAEGLLADEIASLEGLRENEPRLFEFLHFLLALSDDREETLARGMDLLFRALGGTLPARDTALQICRERFRWNGCRAVPVDDSLVLNAPRRLAVAYVVTWLRVAGSISVLPPWVRLEHPLVGELIKRLRETPCASEQCDYCRQTHNAQKQLHAFFGHEGFRPIPKTPDGRSLQKQIVEAGMRDESLMATLPTGGGKSLCYQLPALIRNRRRGVLTIVISPLQALMKDQVDGLMRNTGTPFAAALYGMLTPPERGDVLRRVRMGDVAILYVSPEQLRNRSFADAIAQREIGCWVFDECHCLSKWGHDFRPDYLYAGRFIREFSKTHGGTIPSIACFTATAKQDVTQEILTYFREENGRELALFEGGVERENLQFEVQTISTHDKLQRVHDLLSLHLPNGNQGSAIVFRATRTFSEEAAEYLRAKGWRAAHFHAGVLAPEKKRIQEEFLAGDSQVICATNAFGMGIDKDNVRVVIHADTPGSLENYVQEAGRAGRDGGTAKCILLYDEEDCERQFRMGASSELSRQDIAQILRGLRKAVRGDRQEVVITSGEILRDEDIQVDFRLEDRDADTKVRTAISWLERAGFVERDENVTNVFQARLLVRNLPEAEAKIAPLKLSQTEQALWTAILKELMNAGPTDSITVDRIAFLPEFTSYARGQDGADNGRKNSHEYISGKILKILGSMAQTGLVKRDTLLNAYVRYKVPDHSRLRLERILQLDRKLVDLMAVEDPDPEGWLPLSLRLVNQRLCDAELESSTEAVRALLRSLSEDGRGFAGTHGSIDLRYVARDSYRVRVRRSWKAIHEIAEKRRRVAALLLDVILGKVPANTPARADLLVEFNFEELHEAIERDLLLASELKLKDINTALERAMMYLHEQRVITLQKGLAVFRSAMTIRMQPGAKGEKYKPSHYQPLQHHYRERVLQVHVMSEYARRGLEHTRDALGLVLAYFTWDKQEFIRRYLGSKPDLLQHATTALSYQRIVSDLNNPAQVRVVRAPANRNMLILAGPGSGKTKTVVHRCAYLLRVERVRPQGILVCCFNRYAAVELRRRLTELVGADARGVTVLTYHSLAMRLLGYSFAGRAEQRSKDIDFESLITDAVALLRGERIPAGLEADEVRDRLLAGFQHILVDEYQDINDPQYEMISAIAGRTLEDPDLKLSILAVGDDDQNIYGFLGTNVRFIQRFREDYGAEVHYLVENYRSTQNIIAAANEVIAANHDRMKTDQPIRIDRHRKAQPPGGEFGRVDDVSRGKVQVITVKDGASQASAVLSELRRLRQLGVSNWSSIAVLSSTNNDLAQVRAFAEQEQIPIRWCPGQQAMPALHKVREIHRFLQALAQDRRSLKRAGDLQEMAGLLLEDGRVNPWVQFVHRMLDAWQAESNNAETPVQDALEFLYEECAECRRDFTYGDGVVLSTVHSAKGTEYDHVLLIGPWRLKGDRAHQEEERRAFYVGMTRARQTLMVIDRSDVIPSLPGGLNGGTVLRREFVPGNRDQLHPTRLEYQVMGLDEIHVGYPGHFDEDRPIHSALAALKPGSILRMCLQRDEAIILADDAGTAVARLSKKGVGIWSPHIHNIREVRVLALVHRSAEEEKDPVQRERCGVCEWEIPLVEVVSVGQ